MARPFNPWRDREAAVERLLAAREAGATLRQAAAAAGVHVATVCRWQERDPALREALQEAERRSRRRRYASRPRRRRRVPWHPGCPACGAPARVCSTWRVRARFWRFPARFWRCSRWPACPWASWRPRHPEDCPACGGPRYWAYSRKSVACPGCGRRWPCE
jgi:hypothetical protein